MEGEREKASINAEQQAENINSVSNDGQETCVGPSSSTSASLSSAPDSPKKKMESSERGLSEDIGVLSCPECNIELDPKVHRFCYRCGKTIQEIFSIVHKKEDNNGVQLCPNCNIELDTKVYKFCYSCGKNVREMVADVHKKQDTDHSQTSASKLDSREQIANSASNVASNTKEVKHQVVVGETKVPVAQTVGQESQQLAAVKKTSVNENKTLEEAMAHVGNGKKLNASNTGPSVSGSAEQASNRVIVFANEIEETKQVVAQETVVTETLAESVQQFPASPEMVTVDEQKTSKQVIVVANEIEQTNQVVGQETVVTKTSTKSVQQSPALPEIATVYEQNNSGERNEGGKTGSTDVTNTVQKPNKELMSSIDPDFPRHDENVRGVSESGSSEQISSREIDVATNTEEVKPQVLVGETEMPGAKAVGQESPQHLTAVSEKTPPTVSGSAEQTSKQVIVVANKIEQMNQVVVQETVVTETLTESVQQCPSLPERTTVDEQSSFGKDNEGSKTNPEHVVTLVRGLLFKDGNTTQIPSLQELNEVVDKFDDFVEESQMGRMGNVGDRKCPQECVSDKKEGENKDANKKECDDKKGSENKGVEKKGGENKGVDKKEGDKKEGDKKEGDKKEGENNHVDQQKSEKEIGKKNGERRQDEKKEDEKKEGENKDVDKEKDKKKEDEKKEGEDKDVDEKKGGKKEDEGKKSENKDVDKEKSGKKEDEKKESKNKEVDKKKGEKTDDAKKERENKGQVPKTGETLLEQSKNATTHPLSDVNGSNTPAPEEYYVYRKPDLEKESGKRGKKKEKANQNKTNSTNNGDDKTVIVVFHAILSDKFKWEKDTQIVIRGEEPVFYGWNKGGVPISTEKDFEKQLLLRGEIRVPLRHAFSKFGYKYVLMHKKSKAVYEEIVEYQSRWTAPVNRCLVIGGEHVKENKIFHKYDGFVYPKPGAISWDRFFPSGSAMNDRRAFFLKFFPKWSGFYANSFDVKIQPMEALQNLQFLVEGVSAFWTSTSGYPYRYYIDRNRLKLSEVFEEILMPKLLENLKVLRSQTKDAKTNLHAVVSSVVIAYVFTEYNVHMRSEQYEILLKCLRLPADKEVCSEFMKSINEFDDNILSSFNKIILQFYQQSSSNKSLALNLVPALPLLHFLRGESKPFGDVICEKHAYDRTWKWWGLDELPHRDIRRNITESELIALLPGLKDIFDMDGLLKRTFLLLCRVEMYRDLLQTGCFSCLELCVTMRKLLPDTKNSSSYTDNFVEDLALFFKEINQTLSGMSPEQFPKGRLQETLVLLNNLVYLVQNMTQHLKRNHVQVLCRLVECLVTAIVLQKKGIDLQDEPAVLGNENDPDENLSTSFELKDIPKEMSSLLKTQCGFVDDFVDKRLPSNPEYSRTSEWDQELQVWNEVLSLSVPEIFYKSWHEKFIKKFESRIRKVSPHRQIELFCQSDQQECNPYIASCLSDVAFEAVEKVVKDGNGQQTAFKYLSQNRSANCIKLLSAMLHKAWPPELNEDSKINDEEREEILLHHVLTCSTLPGFLKFFGKVFSK